MFHIYFLILFTLAVGACAAAALHDGDRTFFVFCTFVFIVFFVITAGNVALEFDMVESTTMKEEYEDIVYTIEEYKEKKIPYDADLLNRIAEWNRRYSQYKKNMENVWMADLFPASNIEGTKEIVIEWGGEIDDTGLLDRESSVVESDSRRKKETGDQRMPDEQKGYRRDH
jgi:hypothetical protein